MAPVINSSWLLILAAIATISGCKGRTDHSKAPRIVEKHFSDWELDSRQEITTSNLFKCGDDVDMFGRSPSPDLSEKDWMQFQIFVNDKIHNLFEPESINSDISVTVADLENINFAFRNSIPFLKSYASRVFGSLAITDLGEFNALRTVSDVFHNSEIADQVDPDNWIDLIDFNSTLLNIRYSIDTSELARKSIREWLMFGNETLIVHKEVFANTTIDVQEIFVVPGVNFPITMSLAVIKKVLNRRSICWKKRIMEIDLKKMQWFGPMEILEFISEMEKQSVDMSDQFTELARAYYEGLVKHIDEVIVRVSRINAPREEDSDQEIPLELYFTRAELADLVCPPSEIFTAFYAELRRLLNPVDHEKAEQYTSAEYLNVLIAVGQVLATGPIPNQFGGIGFFAIAVWQYADTTFVKEEEEFPSFVEGVTKSQLTGILRNVQTIVGNHAKLLVNRQSLFADNVLNPDHDVHIETEKTVRQMIISMS